MFKKNVKTRLALISAAYFITCAITRYHYMLLVGFVFLARGFNEEVLATPVQCSTDPRGLNGFVVYDDLTYPLPYSSSAGAGEATVLRWTRNDLWAVMVVVDSILLVLLLMVTFLAD